MFERLVEEMQPAISHVSLPNILSEASNHIGAGGQEAAPGTNLALAQYISSLDEIYQPSNRVVEMVEYNKVGLSDAAVMACAPQFVQDRVAVFTQDFELYSRLCKVNVDCRNIMHWRTPSR